MDLIRNYYRPISVACCCATGRYRTSAPEAWNLLGSLVSDCGLRTIIRRAIGMYLDDPSITAARDIHYNACVDIGPHDGREEMQKLFEHTRIIQDTVPGGIYATQQFSKNFTGIGPALSSMRRRGLAQKNFILDTGRPFLEIHGIAPGDDEPAINQSELRIPVLTDLK